MNNIEKQVIKPTLIPIKNTTVLRQQPKKFALFESAFRPFFLLASVFSIIHLIIWVLTYLGHYLPNINHVNINTFLWHGHEMVFGYAYAVIAGFLLTAVTQWTGQKTLTKKPLFILVCLWLLARVGFLFGGVGFIIAAIGDILVTIWVCIAFTQPVIKSKNHRQYGFISKLVLLLLAQIVFYLGLFEILNQGTTYGIYLGFYLCLAIVLTMGRRVIPFFTQRALNLPKEMRNPQWLDRGSLLLFTIFSLWDTFVPNQAGLVIVAIALFILYSIRSFNWYAKGLFQHSLIWSLWLSNVVLTGGFLLKATAIWGFNSPFLALHAFAFGGIAMMTLAMMARVGLGHTGRSVFNPSKWLPVVFYFILFAAIVRVILPLIIPEAYRILIMSSATLWMSAFVIFLSIYAPILIKPKADGTTG